MPPEPTPEAVTWRPYVPGENHSVVGTVHKSSELHDERLHAARRLLVALPPSYDEADRDYPVVYMHDGRNLFDESDSYAGEWRVDESLRALADDGIEAIVVGVPNAGDDRAVEYTPYPHPEEGGGDVDAYLSWLVESVKPTVDAEFRTRPGREATGLAGSSLGGLVSLYGFFEHSKTFGFAGVMSPAFWWSGEAIFDDIAGRPFVDGRLYLDVGGEESDDETLRRRYVEDAERMVALLREEGYDESRLRYDFDESAVHHESTWAERFSGMFRFLLEE